MNSIPVWAEIDLAAYRHNVESLKRRVGPRAALMAVVKADGYGHGAVELSRAAVTAGAAWLGVARADEALVLRRAGLEAPILVFGALEPHHVAAVAEQRIVATVFSLPQAEVLSASAVAAGRTLRIHVKVDTGMGRLGLPAGGGDTVRDLLTVASLPGLQIEGIYTHFATADRADKTEAERQLDRFTELTERVGRAGLEIPLRHVANSAALISMPESHLDLVRAGIATYGFCPGDEMDCRSLDLRPVMQLKSRILQLREVPADTPLSYGGTYRTPRATTIATLSIGYADGLSRRLSSRGTALVRGRRAPIVGRVCMDLTLIDVGAIADVAVGDEVSLFGGRQEPRITAEEVADLLDTIHYEIVSAISARVPRVYLD